MTIMLEANGIYSGDSRELMKQIEPDSLALSFWSPPYFLGKDYEQGVSYEQWQSMVISLMQAQFRAV